MRRLLALFTGLVTVAALAVAPPAEAADSPDLRAARVLSPGATTQIEVAARSLSDITKVRAVLRPYLGGSESVPVDDFELVDGTAKDGVWRTTSPVTVAQGRWTADIELTNASMTRVLPRRVMIDNGLDSEITEVAVSPAVVDVDHSQVTFRARLLAENPDGTRTPVAGAPVHVQQPSGQIVTVVTGADGRAEGTADFRVTRDLAVVFNGDFMHRPARSAAVPVAKRRLKTRITLEIKGPLIVGDTVTVTGRLERQDRAGAWAPLAGKQVDLQFDKAIGGDWHTIASPKTDGNGVYSVPVLVTDDGAFDASFGDDPVGLPDDYYDYEWSSANTNDLQVTYRTSITGFGADPEPVGRGDMVTGTGRVLWKHADGRWGDGPDADVYLQFSADKKKWTDAGALLVSGDGRFDIQGRATRDGYWRTVVRGDGYLVVPSTSPTDYVDVRYRTKFLDFNASPEPVVKGRTVTIMGTLFRETTKWARFGKQKVSFYFRPKGSTKWTYMGATTADGMGQFRKGFKASKDGTWRAYYGGASAYVKTFRDDYVDVR
ncbi:Htaa domain protein [Actinomadura verrucosospora]|uniref:Htaa domain protein n=2 Tax=Actinomadura verrucosospora TaxID=46165 RepID=A0A7D4A850_ACTVE|nr:Htaa domain protein [Actinomadura verrucosospora]